ncbi:hypothetical protein [Streptosporangium sp. NBC_01756]|nr:hypothetical protein [Streptosporangium sp. NBC_01756]WSC85349.1 hypothetical protein OIE48_34110 [Streptosporangium sp. NBC_01756]
MITVRRRGPTATVLTTDALHPVRDNARHLAEHGHRHQAISHR